MLLTASEIRAVVIGALLAMALAAVDQTIIATALPAMARDLGDVSLLSWIVSAYLLTSTCASPVAGKLSDLYGRRRSLVAALGIFMLGSALCALATGMIPLILARAVQGLGGGSLIALGQTVIGDVVSPRQRAHYSGYFSLVFATTSIVGPSLGGLLTQYWGWPWIFWINLPVGAAALVIVDRALRRLPVHHHKRPIDYAGIVSLSGATVALLLVLSLGGKKLAWTSPEIVVLAAASALLCAVFAHAQLRAAEPVLPPRFLADGVLKPLLASSFIVYGTYLAIAVAAPVYFQVALGTSASEAGLLTIPVVLSTSLTSNFAARHAKRSGRYKLPTLIGLPVAVVAMAVLAFVADRVSPAVAAAFLTLAGCGFGPTFPSASVASLNAVAPRDIGAVSGALTFVRALGAAIAVAASSALVLGLAADALPGGLEGGLQDLVSQALAPAAREAVARAFGVMFGVSAVGFLIGLILFARVEDRLLRDTPAAASSAE
ncbi:MAG TPA: MDR family MFS transporter [Alphaproteobacteria bacterium]